MRRWARLVAVLLVAACGSSTATQTPTDLPADVQQLGTVRFATADEAADIVPVEVALEAARNYGYDYPNPTAYLVVMTDAYADPNSPDAIINKLIWLVRWQDLSVTGGSVAGNPAPIFTHAYVFVDAKTGQAISGEMTE